MLDISWQVSVHGAGVNSGRPVARIGFCDAASVTRMKQQTLQPIAGALPVHSIWHHSSKPPLAAVETTGEPSNKVCWCPTGSKLPSSRGAFAVPLGVMQSQPAAGTCILKSISSTVYTCLMLGGSGLFG